jgi:hypothetical protein
LDGEFEQTDRSKGPGSRCQSRQKDNWRKHENGSTKPTSIPLAGTGDDSGEHRGKPRSRDLTVAFVILCGASQRRRSERSTNEESVSVPGQSTSTPASVNASRIRSAAADHAPSGPNSSASSVLRTLFCAS